MQESCPPPQTPPSPPDSWGWVLGPCLRLRGTKKGCSDIYLKVHWISNATVLATDALPECAQPHQQFVGQRIDAYTGHIPGEAVAVKASPRGRRRNTGFSSLPFSIEASLVRVAAVR